jgi:DNA-binding MarR family transcriptional regulator
MNLPRKTADITTDAMVELMGESFRLNSRLLTTADLMARNVGLTGTRWQVLNAVAQATRPATISDIARWMGLARQSVQQVANALAKGDLIAYQSNPKHQRAPLVVVTKKAAKLLEQLDEQRFAWARTVATTLPATDIKVASEILRAIREQLSD